MLEVRKVFAVISTHRIAVVVLLGLAACGKKDEPKSEEKSPTDETAKVGEVSVSTSPLATSFPEGLSVAAFPTEPVDVNTATVGTVGAAGLTGDPVTNPPLSNPGGGGNDCSTDGTRALADKDGVIFKKGTAVLDNLDPMAPCSVTQQPPLGGQTGGYDPNRTGQAKIKDQRDALEGKAENCLSEATIRAFDFAPNAGERCFQFDYGVMSGKSCQSNDVCLVSYSREVIAGAVAKFDSALGTVEAMLCQAKKDGKGELPAIGATLDLKESMANAAGARLTISAASIKRLPDQNGRPVFVSSIKMVRDSVAREINLAHSPEKEAANGAYSGTMWIIVTRAATSAPANGPANALDTSGVDVMSMKYKNNGKGGLDERVAVELRSARMDKDLVTFESTGELKLPTDSTLDNSKLGAIDYYAFDVNPETSEGSIAFWKNPGANYTEAPRGFVFQMALDRATGLLGGCGIAGADRSGNSIRSSLASGHIISPTGFYTPLICHEKTSVPGTYDNVGDKVWKQCFSFDQTSKSYVLEKTDTSRGFDWILATAAGISVPSLDKFSVATGVATEKPTIEIPKTTSPSGPQSPGPVGPAIGPANPPQGSCMVCNQPNCSDIPNKCSGFTIQTNNCCAPAGADCAPMFTVLRCPAP